MAATQDQNDPRHRYAHVKRTTKETEIEVELNLDGTGNGQIDTGIGFLDHMLDALSKHSRMDIRIAAKGDLHIVSLSCFIFILLLYIVIIFQYCFLTFHSI